MAPSRDGDPPAFTHRSSLIAHRSTDLTEQQVRAVGCRHASVVLSSGAGCGKTHVLTARYLAHLRERDADVGQIVAITFTERAARQMRDRVRKAVLAQVRGADSDAVAERWGRHLRGLETAPISTIHAFCAALLRQHAVEAGLDPRFEVLEDVLAANLQAEALTDCLQRLLTAATPEGEDLRQLVLLYGWRPTATAVEHLLRAHDGPGWDAFLEQREAEIAGGWQRFAREGLLPRSLPHVLATGKVARCLRFLARVRPMPGSKMAGNVQRLLEEVARLGQADDLAAAVDGLVQCAKVGGERGKAWPSEAAYDEAKEVLAGFREDLPGRLGVFLEEPDELGDVAAVARRFLRVAGAAVAAYRQRKRREGVVDFQDLLVLARDLLRDDRGVRERLQRRYRVLLIDELQDTDPVQCELVEHLCGGGLTQGKLFAVGDHKQSIYRFRGADVHRFQDLRSRVPHEGRLDLSVNFRSQPAVLDFVNALLGGRMPDYVPLEPHLPQLNPGPCVEFLWATRADKELIGESRAREADAIARRIAAMVAGERLVADREAGVLRPVRPGDVVLLFRSMSNVALYEAALRRRGLDYYLVGGRAFFALQETYDVLNLLRALENPQDAVSLAGTLRSPFCCLSDEALFLISRHPDGLWAGLHDPARADALPGDDAAAAGRARRNLDRWRGLKDRVPIARLLGEVFADSGYDAATRFEFLGDRKLANLWKLMELARTFDRSGMFGLAEFIQRLGDLVRTQPREEQAATQPENADVVRLMTIHQAKGLEFPVVFVPDVAAAVGGPHLPAAHWHPQLGCVVRPPAEEDPPPFSGFAWELWKAAEAVEDWHEDLRTLYVACTRAQDYLVLSAALADPFTPTNAWTATLAERFDLRSGQCLAPDVPRDRLPCVRVTVQPAAGAAGASAVAEAPGSGPQATADTAVAHSPVDAAAVGPMPVCLAGKRVFTTGEIGVLLRGEAPEALGPQFAAEDGSDRHAWALPGDEVEAGGERALRAVLGQWDGRGPEDWRPLMDMLADGAPADRRRQWESWLAAYERSPTCAAVAAARVCRRDWEFVAAVPGDGHPGFCVRGVLDCLWQDAGGAWHLLEYVTEPMSASQRRAFRRAREPVWALAARAVHARLGSWPADLTVCHLPDGTAEVVAGAELRRETHLDRVRAAVSGLPGPRLPGPPGR